MEPVRIAVIGLGKIARDQHLPALQGSPAFTVAATFSPDGASVTGVPSFESLEELLTSDVGVEAVAICTPPQARHSLGATALRRGLHVFLEKPPTASLAEAASLVDLARAVGVTVFAAWHSRFAAGVDPARAWLAGRRILGATIIWREDVRAWHPGQEWIWEPGIGVFDCGINALSVITQILPRPLTLEHADLRFPANREAPIAADLALTDTAGVKVSLAFDFDQRGPQTWDIDIETDAGALKLSMGASRMAIDGAAVDVGNEPEYARLYRRFARLLQARESDADLRPFQLVADAFLLGRRVEIGPFDW